MFPADIFIASRVSSDPQSARALSSVRPGPRQISFRKDEANNVELCKSHGGYVRRGLLYAGSCTNIGIPSMQVCVVSWGNLMNGVEATNSALVICTITQTTTHIR